MNTVKMLSKAAVVAALLLMTGGVARAALLAYEPFTNAPGTAIIGRGWHGFSGAWQDYQTSLGTATNTDYGLGYTDGAGNSLVTRWRGFFSGANQRQYFHAADPAFQFQPRH